MIRAILFNINFRHFYTESILSPLKLIFSSYHNFTKTSPFTKTIATFVNVFATNHYNHYIHLVEN